MRKKVIQNALFQYAQPSKKKKFKKKEKPNFTKTQHAHDKENAKEEETALAVWPKTQESENQHGSLQPNSVQNRQNNQMQKASNLFQSATFNNCMINLQMPN